jgi:hypothetical protein
MDNLDRCGDILSAKLDNFATALAGNPNALGYVIIYGDKKAPHEKYFQEGRIKRRFHSRYSYFPFDRVSFLHGADKNEFEIQFWITPTAADKPNYSEAEWSYLLSQNIKPFLVNVESKDMDGGDVCFSSIDSETFSKLLLANPNLLGRVVIYADSVKGFRRRLEDSIKEISVQYKVPGSQLKFIHKKRKNNYQSREFWLIPKNKN